MLIYIETQCDSVLCKQKEMVIYEATRTIMAMPSSLGLNSTEATPP